MENIVDLVLLFFMYSFLGWCMEVYLKYRQFHRFINRGFLTGPWLPIYGFGTVLITVAVRVLAPYESSLGTTFVLSFFLCGGVEYLVSWFLEKMYHARWWDYSQKPMNLNGRVWIGNLILFGLAGVIIIRITNPLLLSLFSPLPLLAREIVAAALTALIIADYVITSFVLKLVKVGVECSQADNTEEIGQEVRLLLSDRNYFYRRFADAYPNVIYRTERINARMEEIKAENERLRQLAEKQIAMRMDQLTQAREQLAASLEPTSQIRANVISKQNALLNMVYDENRATEEMRALKGEIDRDMERLRKRRAAE